MRHTFASAARIAVVALLLPVPGIVSAQQRATDAGVLLQAAVHQETVNGNLDSAIMLYRRVAEDRRADRGVVAKALVSLGRAYEALGSTEARKAYERVVRDFADQPAHADVARERLATLVASNRPVHAGGPVARRLWSGQGVDLMGAPSSDGKLLTFTDWSTGELAVRDLSAGTQRNVTNSGGWNENGDYAELSEWSPDGKQVAYTWFNKDNRYELRLVRADGGSPRVIVADAGDDYMWTDDWSPDGKYLLVNFRRIDNSNQMALVSVATGAKTVLRTFDWRWPLEMGFSPDGRWIAYDFPPVERAQERDVYIMAVDGSRETIAVKHAADDRFMGWARDGSGIFFTTNRRGVIDLMLQPVRAGQANGDMQVVRADGGAIEPLGLRGSDFYYGTRSGGLDVYIGEIDLASGTITKQPAKLPMRIEGRNHRPAWSSDGQLLAHIVEPSDPGGLRMIAVRSVDGDTERRLPIFNFLRVFEMHWSPGQKSIYMVGNSRKHGIGIFQLDLATGEQRPIVVSNDGQGTIGQRPDARMFDVTPDGRAIVYWRVGDGKNLPHRIMVHDLSADTSRVIHSVPSNRGTWGFYGLVVSPDGRELAFGQLEGAPNTSAIVNVIPIAGGAVREVTRRPRPAGPIAWINGGRDILFEADPPERTRESGRRHRHELWSVPASGGDARQLEVDAEWLLNLRLHPDGKRFAIAFGEQRAEVWVLENALPKQAARK